MLAEMRPSELGMWRALHDVDPWTEERADLRMAINSQLTAQSGLKKAGGAPFTIEEFMPFREQPAPGKVMAAQMRAFFSGLPRKKKE